MQPIKNKSSFVDLLDRILEKGAIINADILIHVAGIPLIAVSLRAAIAGIETMLKYGMMEAWDERIRNNLNLDREYKGLEKEEGT